MWQPVGVRNQVAVAVATLSVLVGCAGSEDKFAFESCDEAYSVVRAKQAENDAAKDRLTAEDPGWTVESESNFSGETRDAFLEMAENWGDVARTVTRNASCWPNRDVAEQRAYLGLD